MPPAFYPFISGPKRDSYFITLTLKPKWYTKNATEQFDKTLPHIKLILKEITERNPEKDIRASVTAELTNTGNIHYHMWVYHEPLDDHNDWSRIMALTVIDSWKTIGGGFLSKGIVHSTEQISKVYSYMKKDLGNTGNVLTGRALAISYQSQTLY